HPRLSHRQADAGRLHDLRPAPVHAGRGDAGGGRRGSRRDSVRAALSERTPAPARAVRAKAWPTGYIAPRFAPVFPLRPYAGLSPLVTVSARTHLNSVPATRGRWAHPFRRPSVAALSRVADQTARVRGFPTPPAGS